MIHVCIKYHEYRSYTETSECIIAGRAFHQDRLYKGSELHSLVLSWDTKEKFVNGIQKINGFYAIIARKDSQLFVAVDRVRSIPLFYGQKANDFYLSDCADWVREQVCNTEFDSLAKEEFLLTGYVTGPDTLFSDVKQLQAGEALIVSETNGKIHVKTYRYYQFVHEYEQEANIDELIAEHDQMLTRIFNRLIQVADGQTIVVPLSGGLDSRLIVLMLKRLGYENIITFTYGRPGNKEAEVSRKVAELLGLRWEFIPYSNEDWYRWFNSAERMRYWQFANGLTSLPHIQDWPAVWELKNQRLIPDDIIFVPGHTGDFISGGHIPVYFEKAIQMGLETLAEAVLKKHYSLHELDEIWGRNKTIIRNRIISLSEAQSSLRHSSDAASAFEKWEWQERQAKFIVNSVRVYEFWGCDWWLPLWDYEYMQFWCGVPLEFRLNQTMYKQFVNQLFQETTGYTLAKDDLNPSLKQRLKNTLRPYLNETIKSKLKKIIKANKFSIESEYQSHPLAWYGILSEDYFKSHYTGKENINSFLTRLYFEET